MNRAPDISVVSPTFNGLSWLKKHWDSWTAGVARAEAAGLRCELVVVDDGSTDGSRDWLARKRDARTLALPGNSGFGAAANAGVREARAPWVYLLNNDVETEADFLAALAPYLSREDLFAVVSRSAIPDGRVESATRLDLRGALRIAQPGLEDAGFDAGRAGATLHAAGGFGLFRRDRFLALGGFDAAYHPFYWEDVDLCVRAWREGWASWYEPSSRVRHRGRGTIGGLYRPEEVRRIHERGRLVFALRHFGDRPELLGAADAALLAEARGIAASPRPRLGARPLPCSTRMEETALHERQHAGT